MDPASETPGSVAFGRFRVLPHRRELLVEGQPVRLGGRAFDVMMALIEARGRVVSKNALMARVWPNCTVEENNLQAQILALRKAFGADRGLIRTVAGRGYQFTGEIRALAATSNEPTDPGVVASQATLPPTNLPEQLSELIGRNEELGEILNLASTRRFLTLTGAGGIGKTALALAFARELRPHFADGVWLAEFSALADPGTVPATIAVAVGLDLGGGEASVQRVAQTLAGRRLLLMLDTCEHVVHAAAAIAEAVLEASSSLHVVATSREPLRAKSEWVYAVQPLSVPAKGKAVDNDPLQYGAVRLFIERARAAGSHFTLDREFERIVSICWRLDGIPLALELAAACVTPLGLEVINTRLDDRFGLLSGGRRTALPRHQTLRATLDWSHELLSDPERVLLRRLAVFAGLFSLRAVVAVTPSPGQASSQVIDGLVSLVEKSLVTVEAGGTGMRYRLLDTTRAYALEKLVESGERESLARRHAEYYRDLFEQAEAEWNTRPAAEWLADFGPSIDNLRAALDWALSSGGDASIGVSLAAAAVPLWMHLLLLGECRNRAEQALAAMSGSAIEDRRCEMKLLTALSQALRNTRSSPLAEIAASSQKALDIAESLGDIEYQLQLIWTLWSISINAGRYHSALDLAERFCAMAPLAASQRLTGKRMIGIAHHFLGDQSSAGLHLKEVLADYDATEHRWHLIRFQLDLGPATWVFLARVLWVQGFPEQARDAADCSVELAQASNHSNTLWHSLILGACPIAVWMDNVEAADHYLELLLEGQRSHASGIWHNWGRFYRGLLVLKRGDVAAGLRMLRSGFEEIGDRADLGHSLLLGTFAEALGYAGKTAEGLVAIEEGVVRAERNEEGWIIAELLRIKAELFLLNGGLGAAAAAEQLLRQACEQASRRGALSWELRAATSLARLLRDYERLSDARAVLWPVYDRFTEGFDTGDLKAAKTLLDQLR